MSSISHCAGASHPLHLRPVERDTTVGSNHGVDLNQRPLGYEGNRSHHSNQAESTQTPDDDALLNGAVRGFGSISVGLLHSCFIGFERRGTR